MNRRKLAGLLGFVLFLFFAGAAAYKIFHPVEKGITATGTVEVTRADITPKISGYLRGLMLQVGDKVTLNQEIVQIVRLDLAAQVLRDQAALRREEAQLTDLTKGAREQELSEAAASVASAQSVYEKAQTDYDRYLTLRQSEAISQQQFDVARSTVEVAYHSLVAAQAKQSLLEAGNRPDAIAAQKLAVEQAAAVLKASQAIAADTTVLSPLTGLVLTKNYEEGEYVNAGAAIATLGNMNDCWVKIYVDSTQLGLLQIGQEAAVKIDSFPERTFTGTVKEISQNAEFTPRQSLTQRERANLVFAVKVKIDNQEGLLKPGMPADVILK